jgi:hypothetical protein
VRFHDIDLAAARPCTVDQFFGKHQQLASKSLAACGFDPCFDLAVLQTKIAICVQAGGGIIVDDVIFFLSAYHKRAVFDEAVVICVGIILFLLSIIGDTRVDFLFPSV